MITPTDSPAAGGDGLDEFLPPEVLDAACKGTPTLGWLLGGDCFYNADASLTDSAVELGSWAVSLPAATHV